MGIEWEEIEMKINKDEVRKHLEYSSRRRKLACNIVYHERLNGDVNYAAMWSFERDNLDPVVEQLEELLDWEEYDFLKVDLVDDWKRGRLFQYDGHWREFKRKERIAGSEEGFIVAESLHPSYGPKRIAVEGGAPETWLETGDWKVYDAQLGQGLIYPMKKSGSINVYGDRVHIPVHGPRGCPDIEGSGEGQFPEICSRFCKLSGTGGVEAFMARIIEEHVVGKSAFVFREDIEHMLDELEKKYLPQY